MKKSLSGNLKFGTIVLVAWLIFSVAYIAMDMWRGGLKLANKLGYEKAYVEVISRSQGCEPFRLFAGEVAVDLINVACLQQSQEGSSDNQASDEEAIEEIN